MFPNYGLSESNSQMEVAGLGRGKGWHLQLTDCSLGAPHHLPPEAPDVASNAPRPSLLRRLMTLTPNLFPKQMFSFAVICSLMALSSRLGVVVFLNSSRF